MVDGIDNSLPLVVQWVLGLLGLRTQRALVPQRVAVDYRLRRAEWKVPASAALPTGWEVPTIPAVAVRFQSEFASGLPPTFGAPPRLAWSIFRHS